MSEISIRIPADERFKPLAAAIGAALCCWANGEAASNLGVTTNAEKKPEPDVLTTADIAKSVKASIEADLAKTVDSGSNVVKLNSATGHTDSTSTTAETAVNQEQSTATQTADVGGANAATGARQPSGNDLGNVDKKGVGKHTDFCGNAKVPFNATGKKKGQWKKRQGVTEEVYDDWYAQSLLGVGAVVADTGGEQQIDTTAAFNGDGNQSGSPEIDTTAAFSQQQTGQVNGQVVNNGQSQQREVVGGLTFEDAGAYMKWQSEQQAAGNLTTGDVESAHAQTGVGIQDLFNPAAAANAVASLYNFLAPIAGGQ